ncbi:ankyrin repeat domain-containing protein [Aspergillus mulundensis]|uniref:Uncharacterized protein n=1 Tax=Aspergillus mulundensis TaxID=1810919 RepID=A0A3D8QZY1_9EURO|nr:hypothetical protein DSM5745_09114 [Aspergillus mulundensis]RDW67248.1 hypothetical protein DSM5745_09114 [Aspergillus mulundensis]
MPSLLTLPEELILIICENMTRPSLATFLRTNTKAHRIGQYVLYKLPPTEKLRVFTWALTNARHTSTAYLLPSIVALSTTDTTIGATALASACAATHVVAVTALLDGGVSANASFPNGTRTALIAAAEGTNYNDAAQCVRLLLSHGANPDATDSTNRTALHFAASRGNLPVINDLLGAGADVHARNNLNQTPILLAASRDQYLAVQRLLGNGANINDSDTRGRTVLIIAADRGMLNIVRLAVQSGADVNAVNGFGRTAVSWAAEHGNENVVEVLVGAGCDVNLRDRMETSPLDYCVLSTPAGRRVRALLVKAGAEERGA